MTAPVWMAAPPEVHSGLLNAGPGPGPLLAAAQAWRVLGAEYADAAREVQAVTTAVRAGLWEGPSAESYAASHAPYLGWLLRAASDSATTAVQLDTAAAAHTAAVATMPTLGELAANHATHAVLSATNFFGVNTIPIAVNEADYVRMWVQAATTMTVYESTSAAAVASAPPETPAPVVMKANASYSDPPQFNNPLQGLLDQLEPLLKSLGITDGQVAHDPMISNDFTTLLAQILRSFGAEWDPTAGTLNGQVYDYYADASQPIWYLARSLELIEDFFNITQNPGQAIQALQYLAALILFDWPTHIAQLFSAISESPALLFAAAGAALAPAGAAGGLAGLAGLAALPQPVPLDALAPLAPSPWPVTTVNAVISAPPGAPTPTAPAPTPSTITVNSPPPPAPTPGAAGFAIPYAVGPPGIGFGSGAGLSADATNKRRTPESDRAATAAQSQVASSQRRTRRRQRQARDEHGREYVSATAESSAEPAAEASNRSAGPIGFAGTQVTAAPAAIGLASYSDNTFDDGTSMPMLPASWQSGTNT